MKHTPGPWRVSGLVTKAFHVLNKGGYLIASVSRASAYPKAHIHNARLNAAAPELMEALQDAISRLEGFIGSDCECDNTHANNNTQCCLCGYRAILERMK